MGNRGWIQDSIDRLDRLLVAAKQVNEFSTYSWGMLTLCHLRFSLAALSWDKTDDQSLKALP